MVEMKCKYYDEDKCICQIADTIPSHPEYCRLKPDNCEAYNYAEEHGLEKAKRKYRNP